MSETYNVLVLCTGNSARSILGEMLVNRLGKGRFHANSAGSTPTGKVNPFAVRLLREKGYSIDGLRSKSWEEFAESGAPTDVVWMLDYLFTTVLDGRNAYLTDGVHRSLGRPPKDFSDYAREIAATGVWRAVA